MTVHPTALALGRRRLGFTVVELLIAAAILVVVLGAATAFFAQQAQLQRGVQTRNELQDRVRVAMQFLSQDLALAGNPALIDANGVQIEPGPFPGCPGTPERCLELVDVADTSSTLRVRYVSSQFPAGTACRDVAYRLNGAVLERSDVACDAAGWGTPDWVPIAPSTLGFKVLIVCSATAVGAMAEVPDASCSAPTGYARTALVSVAAESTSLVSGATGTPWTVVGLGRTEDCAVNRLCYDSSGEVLLPNLKDR